MGFLIHRRVQQSYVLVVTIFIWFSNVKLEFSMIPFLLVSMSFCFFCFIQNKKQQKLCYLRQNLVQS